jgi:hypothetical protein
MAGNATAATRFAGPGGTGAEPCASPANPCSFFTAADQAGAVQPGDVVVLAPGEYSDAAGDLGPGGVVNLEEGIDLHGAAGSPRPVIHLIRGNGFGALVVRSLDKVSHIEIETAVSRFGILIASGRVEDLIVRSSTNGPLTVACFHLDGIIRNSACLSSGRDATALGGSPTVGSGVPPRTLELRNVTARATGTGSRGIEYRISGDLAFNVGASGVIASGKAADVSVAGFRETSQTPGARVTLDLDHSSYATVETATDAGGGTATVTPAGSGTNIDAPPLLAADGFHQLPGSPTVDSGTPNPLNPATDIDGEPRVQGAAPDIGADEHDKFRTTTTVSCAPARVRLDEVAVCTTVVIDPSTPPGAPADTVQLVSDGQGTFPDGPGCDLDPEGAAGEATCTATYVPRAGEGIHRITAAYPGAGRSDPSQGTDLLAVGNRRFAAPGGDGVEPCMDPAHPCSIFTAADQSGGARAGDEVVLAPGEYSDTAADLGPDGSVLLAEGISLHGRAGEPRPVIELNSDQAASGAITIQDGDAVSHLEIVTDVAPTNVTMTGGTLEDFIGHSNAPGAIVCRQTGGLIRNSACLNDGEFGAAIGNLFGAPDSAVFTTRLRNVTAISTGVGSSGIRYNLSTNSELEVDAKGVIAKGRGRDVAAEALSQPPRTRGTGAEIRIDLDHSNYATVRTLTDEGEGIASITEPGTSDNVTAPPLLAADGLHQLPGSPTVDNGATDDLSSGTDIDGEARAFSAATDIGADERLAFATSTTVKCLPSATLLGETVSCVVTAASAAADPSQPTGTVELSSNRAGDFLTGRTCTLAAGGPTTSQCAFSYRPSEVAPDHQITAAYAGDETREPSGESISIPVSAPPRSGGDPPRSAAPPQTTLGKRPRKKTAQRSALFTFSSDQANSYFECKLDNRPFRPCASPSKRTVKPGRHTFQVRAVSAAGPVDPTPAIVSWTVSRPRR